MSDLKKYYDDIRLKISHEQLAQEVIKGAVQQPKRRRGAKPLAVVAAAAVVLAVGVSGAAATGLIDLNAVFGGKIVAEDEQLANSLMAAAEDLEWIISDDDYMIEFKGLTGSERDMMLLYNIVRKDGKPVVDFMTDTLDAGALYCSEYIDFRAPTETEGSMALKNPWFDNASHATNMTVNDDGNIEVYRAVSTDGKISGQYYKEECSNIDVQCLGLELEWSVGFIYKASNTGRLHKSISGNNEVISLTYATAYGGLGTAEFNITKSYFSSLGGRLTLERYGAELMGNDFEEWNDIYLIMDDGTEIGCVAYSGGVYYNRQTRETRLDAQIRYSDTVHGTVTAVDVGRVTAISVNGTICPVS